MKRILTIVLSCMLVFGTFSAFAAQKDSTEESVETAIALGLLSASARQNEAEISRGEFIAAVMKLCGDPVATGGNPFSDADTKNEYYNALCAAYEWGFVSGYGDGTVRPQSAITKEDAVRILTYCIGFREIVVTGGFSVAKAAAEVKLCNYDTARSKDSLSLGDAADLLIKAGNTYMIREAGIQGEEVSYSYSEDTVFSCYRDIYTAIGVVTGNSLTYLKSVGSLSEGRVQINNTVFFEGDSNASALLGRKVKAYYEQKGMEDGTILYAYAFGGEELFVSAKDFAKTKAYSGGVLHYYNENGKAESENINLTSVYMIYNGRLNIEPAASDFETITSGGVTLVDNNGDGDWDVMFVDSYRDCVVSSIDRTEQVIYFKYNEAPVKLDGDADVEFVADDGSPMDLVELAEDDVLCVAESKDKSLLKVLFIQEVVEGTIESYSTGSESEIVIDGTSYRLTNACATRMEKEIKGGVRVVAMLNASGDVAHLKLGDSLGNRLGYLIATDTAATGLSSDIKVRLLSQDGTIFEADLSKRVNVDGVSYDKEKDKAKICARLVSGVVVFRLDEEGKVCYLDTPYSYDTSGGAVNLNTGESTESLCKYDSGSSLYFRKTQMVLGQQIAVTDRTVVMKIPTTDTGNFDNYQVTTVSKDLANNQAYSVEAYRLSENSSVADLLVRKYNPISGGFDTSGRAVLVESLTVVVNENGEKVHRICGYMGSSKIDRLTTDESVLEGKNVKAGDIVQLAFNFNGEVRNCSVLHSVGSDKLSTSNPSSSNYRDEYRFELGYVWKTDGNYFLFTRTPLEANGSYSESDLDCVMKSLLTYKVYTYDKETQKVRSGGNLSGFQNTGGQQGSKLFVYDGWGDGVMLVIYE